MAKCSDAAAQQALISAMRGFRWTAPLAGALFLAACGGGSSVDSGVAEHDHRLVLSAEAPVAGVSWSMAADAAEVEQALWQAGLSTWGHQVRVLRRPAATVAGSSSITEWLVFAPGSQGATQGVFLQRKAGAAPLAAVSDVQCSSPVGNPVGCTLQWRSP